MLNKDIHKNILINTLNSIYKDTQIRTFLGFKGGTAALLFYELPRFSVDLDFDLLDQSKKELVFQRLKEILSKIGKIDQAHEKQNTLFFLINYKNQERNIKVEISKRPLKSEYEVKSYLGIPMLVMKKDDMAASKLLALVTRKKFATRDMFDLWYFLVNNWSIDEELIRERTGFTTDQVIDKAQERIKNIKKTELLAGLGDLLDNKQKAFVKEKLRDELSFQLKLYLSNLSKRNSS